MKREAVTFCLSLAGATLLGLAALDWVAYTRFLLSLGVLR